MDFNSSTAKRIYSDRTVSESWKEWIKNTIRPQSKVIADIGCGGGIYSKGFYELGASLVIMVDGSEKYIEEVKKNLSLYQPIVLVNDCTNLDINDGSVDIVFERALIHHLSIKQMESNLLEIHRIIKPDGQAVIQDRTYQDVIKCDERFWVRNTLFECFPKLLEYEKSRRPDSVQYDKLIKQCGLKISGKENLPEIRKTYSDIEGLCSKIMKRKGKSILFELTDNELAGYCLELKKRAPEELLIEQDMWTVWHLCKF